MKMSGARFALFLAVMAVVYSSASAADPDPLQDFCVGLPSTVSPVFVNGKFCKNPVNVTADDFFFSGINIPANTATPTGINITAVIEPTMPGLNHQGLSLIRIDYAPHGVNPPHVHPRATELFFVMKGTIYAGFTAANPTNPLLRNRLYAKILHAGDVFLFPRGLMHFNFNIGKTKALAFATFNSQNPGVFNAADSVFGTIPPIYPEVIAKSFQMDEKSVEYLQSLNWSRRTG